MPSTAAAHVAMRDEPDHLWVDRRRFVIVSTQGKGDVAALKAAMEVPADYHGFVGSRRKMAALRARLRAEGIAADALDAVKAPAGLDIGAISPEEIALSILAEVTALRRRGQRAAAPAAERDDAH